MKKYLIAGIGFTESYWAEHLTLEGLEVVVLNNIRSSLSANYNNNPIL